MISCARGAGREVGELAERRTKPKTRHAESLGLCNFGSKRACCIGGIGGERVPSTPQITSFPPERDTTPR